MDFLNLGSIYIIKIIITMYKDYKVVYHNDFEIVDLAGGGKD